MSTRTPTRSAVAPRAPALVRVARVRWLAVVLTALSAAGCASQPAVTVRSLPSAIVSQRADALDPQLIEASVGEREGDAYRLGPGDTLLVVIYDHPELSIAPFVPIGASVPSGRPVGLLVDNDGTLQLPLIGAVKVSGLTTQEVREALTTKLATYVKEPHVSVQVLFAGNIRYYLLGQFASPGLKYSDRPLGLLEATSLGGSIDLANASLRSAYVARNGKKLPVDFGRLLLDGDLRQNIRLKTGDVIFVPDHQTDQAFVFGGVATSNPAGGAVPFVHGRLTLLQALARAGFGYSERFQGRLSDVHIIRSDGDHGELFVVDANAILRGDAAPFDLAPGDVVFVPPTALSNWDQALGALIPFLQAVAGILEPFVQIKYLSTH